MLAALYLWLCFIKLPLTARRDAAEQSWEPVLSYATAHHLQWGRDIVFTFGPLGFLTSDHYWGNHFWPILLWALAFGLALAVVFLRFSQRVAPSIRLVLYLALPLLTTPSCEDLGFDPIYFLAITLLGIACLPHEHPGPGQLVVTGLLFGFFSLIKFTFAIYGGYVIVVLLAAHGFSGVRLRTWPLVSGWVAALVLAGWGTGQSPANLVLFFWRAAILSAGYSSAMALEPKKEELLLGLAVLLGFTVLVLLGWLFHKERRRRAGPVAILAGGVALAWKEGFVRPDVHVIVFFLYAFLVMALVPALLQPHREVAEPSSPPEPNNRDTVYADLGKEPVVLGLTAVALLMALTPFATSRRDFTATARRSLLPRLSDSLTALFTPLTYKTRVETLLGIMRTQAALPRIQAATGNAPVAVVGFDQDVAILNGLNYVPHPVFQNYSAFTAALQDLNTRFFNSASAPEFVLCRLNSTLDGRFPTQDDGEVLLKVLTAYSPVLEEEGLVLWRRNGAPSRGYAFGKGQELAAPLGTWIHIATDPAWVCVQCKRTWLGIVQGLLRGPPELRIEVRLNDGHTAGYRLVAGTAQNGFLLNPLPHIELKRLKYAHVAEVRIYTLSPRSFAGPVRLFVQPIDRVSKPGVS